MSTRPGRADKPLALTFGEPAGIGPDISLTAWSLRKEHDLPAFYLVADPEFWGDHGDDLVKRFNAWLAQ